MQDRATATEAARQATHTMRGALAMLDMMTGGGANTLLVAFALGEYARLQVQRSVAGVAAAGVEANTAAAVFDEACKLVTSQLEEHFAGLPALSPEVVRYAVEHDCNDYNEARRGLEAQQAAIVADPSVN